MRSISVRNKIITLLCLAAGNAGLGQSDFALDQSSIPPAATMGIADLLVSGDAEALIKTAHQQGYRVYAEVPVSNVTAPAPALTSKSDLAGIVLNAGSSQPSQVEAALVALRSAYADLPILVLDTRGKQPQMKGQLVIKRDGVLQVTSPTAQPWIDSNLATDQVRSGFPPQSDSSL